LPLIDNFEIRSRRR